MSSRKGSAAGDNKAAKSSISNTSFL